MIQQLFNGILTLLLAKFMLNDVPHAVGLTCTVVKPKPAYELGEGTYSWDKLVQLSPRSAAEATMYAEVLRRHGRDIPSLGLLTWEFLPMRAGSVNSWVSTMSKYVGYSPEELSGLVDSLPIEDYRKLSSEAEAYFPQWYTMSPEERQEVREAFLYWLQRNVERAQYIRKEIIETGRYYPPVVCMGETLDGAHRLAVLQSMCGPGFEVWMWTV